MTESQRNNAESQRNTPDREKVVVEDEFHKLWTDEQAKIVRENAARLKQMTEAARYKLCIHVRDPGAICLACKWPLYPEDHPHYCGNCGAEVKWDG